MKNKYIVTYKTEFGGVGCQIMTGQELAEMVGFSDCSEEEVIEVWEMSPYGNLMPVSFHYPDHAPFNRIVVEDVCGIAKEYYWEEH